ncbi:MAG: PKD domain-containing protein [Cyclobacteriaceae bacterium]|nr:PKD domain-containing protein [Cyclobacteriaceae bacterium]
MHAGTAFVVYTSSDCWNSYIRVRLQDGSDVYYKHIKPSSTNPVTNQPVTEITNNNGQGTPVQVGTFLGVMFGNVAGEGGCDIHVHINQNTTGEALQGETNFINRFVNPFTDTERPLFMYPFGGYGTATDNTSANGYKIAEFRMNGHSKTNTTNQLGESESINGTIYKYAYGKIDIVTRLKDVQIGTGGGSIGGNSGVNAASYSIINSAGVAIGQEIENLNFNTIPLNERGNYVFDNRSNQSNHVYILTNNPTAANGRYDQFWNTNLRSGQTEDWDLTNRGNKDARSIDEAYYPDGKYLVRIRAKDITNFDGTIEATERDVPVIIDNFRPYAKEIIIRKGNALGRLVYRGVWKWNGTALQATQQTFDAAGPTDKVWIKITISESAKNVRVNIPSVDGTNYSDAFPPPQLSNYSVIPVPNSNDTEFIFIRNAITPAGVQTLNIQGEDLAGNPLQTNPSQIPTRLADGTWETGISSGVDSNHKFNTGNDLCVSTTFPGGRKDTGSGDNATSATGCLYADFSVSKTNPVVNEPVIFAPVVSGTGQISYQWDFGSGATPATSTTSGNQTVLYSTLGPKTITLKICDITTNCVTEQKIAAITVSKNGYSELTVDFTASQFAANTGQTIQLNSTVTGAVGNVSYWWQFDNGVTQAYYTEANPIIAYGTPGNKTISLIVTDDNGSVTKVKNSYLFINSLTFNISPSILGGCLTTGPDGSTSFSAAVSGGNGPPYSYYRWDLGDGRTSTLASFTHTYARSGKYTVRLTVCDATGCGTTESVNCVTVPPIVDARSFATDFSVNDVMFGPVYSAVVVGLNTPVTYTDASIGAGDRSKYNYSWDFESHYFGGTTESASPATANTRGPHEVYFTTTGYKESSLTVVTEANANRKTRINSVEVRNGLGSGRCYANIGTATISSTCWSASNPPQFTVPTSKTNCPIAKTEVLYWPHPGSAVTLPNNKLDFAQMNVPVPAFPLTADFSFAVYQYDGVSYNRIGYKRQRFTIYGPVTANAGPDQQVCLGSSVTLGTTSSNELSYLWTSPNASDLSYLSSTTAANPTFSGIQKGTYTYSLKTTNLSSGCTSTSDNVVVTVNRPEVAPLSLDLKLNQSTTLNPAVTGGFGNNTYSWQPATKLSSGTVAAPVFTSSSEGDDNYIFTVTDQRGCQNNGEVYVNTSDAAGDIKATALSYSRILVTWQDRAANETGYRIQRSVGNNTNFIDLGTVGANVTSYEDVDVVKGTDYYYRVVTLFGNTTKASVRIAYVNTASLPLFTKTDYPTWDAFGDMDNDGQMEYIGLTTTGLGIYKYSESGFTLWRNIEGAFYGQLLLADFDNDNDLDMYLYRVGSVNKIAINLNGGNSFQVIDKSSSKDEITLTDANSDNSVDLITGVSPDFNNDELHLNIGNNQFNIISLNTKSYGHRFYQNKGFAEFSADYDNDGDLDYITNTSSSAYQPGPLKLFLNENQTFNNSLFLSSSSNFPIGDGGDVNNDGKKDYVFGGNWIKLSQILNKGSNGFLKIELPLNSIRRIKLGDFDYDGDLDLLLAQNSDNYEYVNPVNIVLENNGGTWVTSFAVQTTNVNRTNLFENWIDFDNDGDLDINGNGMMRNNLRSNKLMPNTPPTSPLNLCTYRSGNTLTMSWSAASDGQTPAPGLTYNIYVKQNGKFIQTPLSNLATGYRKVVGRGNVDHNLSWSITLPGSGPVEWGVQAIDNQYIGSPFATTTFSFVPSITTQTFCSGSTTNVTVNSPGVNPQFTWAVKSISANVSGASAGSGTLLAQTLVNTSTTAGTVVYAITQTISGCSSHTFDYTVTVNPQPASTISVGGPTTFCAGTSVRLTAPAGSAYSWSRGQSTPYIDATSSGNYFVTVYNSFGCSKQSNAVSVTVKPSPSIYVNPGTSVTICEGSTVQLSAGPEFSSGKTSSNTITRINTFMWSNGSIGSLFPTINASTGGVYTVTAMSLQNQCTTTASVTVNMIPATAPIYVSQDLCTYGYTNLYFNGTGYNSLIWSTGQTSSSINVYSGGTYDLTVYYSGCTAYGSIYIEPCGGGGPCRPGEPCPISDAIARKASDTPTNGVDVEEPTIYPNPTGKQFTVAIPGLALADLPVQLIDQTGKFILLNYIQKGQNHVIIETPDIANGLYLIQIGSGESAIRKKIEILKE